MNPKLRVGPIGPLLLISFALAGCLSNGSESPPETQRVSPDNDSNSRPTISGSPPSTVEMGAVYSFTPIAADSDGDELTFEIRNRPTWATFDSTTGRLSGVPALGDLGEHAGIVISVSDGKSSSALQEFSVTVMQSVSNSRPTISGDPPQQAVINAQYSFTPTASDPDGDNLRFSIENQPSWLSFNDSTGTLSGSPSLADVGSYDGIRITVSDGELEDSLGPFSIQVTQSSSGSITLTWTPPTTNDDGTPLTDLAGYKIYYGVESGIYTDRVVISNPSISTYVIDNLAPNTYYFVATAFNQNGFESDFSDEIQSSVN